VDQRAAAEAIAQFLRALGQQVEGELAHTPEQVAQAWCEELLDGYGVDAAALLREGSLPTTVDDRANLVVLRDLPLTIICPHHLLPASGHSTIIYRPNQRLAGFGTIARVLAARARRLTLQERVGVEVAELLVEQLGARGALCQLRMVHTCLAARGPRQTSAVVETLALAGSFQEPGPDRDLALATLGQGAPVAAAAAPATAPKE